MTIVFSKTVFSIIFLILIFLGCNESNNKINCVDGISFNKDAQIYQITNYFKSTCKVESLTEILDTSSNLVHGNSILYYENGNIMYKRAYIKGRSFGQQFDYFKNGKFKSHWFVNNNDEYVYVADYDSSGNVLRQEGCLAYLFHPNDTISKNDIYECKLYLTHMEGNYKINSFKNGNRIDSNVYNFKYGQNKYGYFLDVKLKESENGVNTIEFLVELKDKNGQICTERYKSKFVKLDY